MAAMTATVRAAGEEAERRKLPLIVHATGLAEAKAALAAGAKLLVHSVWDQPVDDEFLDLARKQRRGLLPDADRHGAATCGFWKRPSATGTRRSTIRTAASAPRSGPGSPRRAGGSQPRTSTRR